MPAIQPSDRRRRRGAASRQAIIEAAIASIATGGLCNMTLDRVAERAGVSRALVVFHFKSKSRMLVDVLNHMEAVFSAEWDAILKRPHQTPSETLFDLLEYDVRFGRDRPDYLSVWNAFWGEVNGSTLYREVILPRDERYGRDLRALIAALVDDGGYDRVDPKATETGIMAMLFGLWLNAHLNPTPDYYSQSMHVLRVYLASVFPRHFDATLVGSLENDEPAKQLTART